MALVIPPALAAQIAAEMIKVQNLLNVTVIGIVVEQDDGTWVIASPRATKAGIDLALRATSWAGV